MYAKPVAKNLQDCYAKAVPNTQVANQDFIIKILKVCYDYLDITFTDCDRDCIIENIVPNSTTIPAAGPAGYDSAKLEDFYNTAAKENIELCYYNCHHSHNSEL
jgi:hypothetical protein